MKREHQYDNSITAFLQEILDGFKLYPKDYAVARCPFHDDEHPSLFVDPKTGRFNCKACKEVGGLVKLTAQAKGLAFEEAKTLLNRLGLLNKSEGREIEAEYLYWKEDGSLAFKKVRYRRPDGTKTFAVFTYDYEKEKWVSGKGEVEDVVYNLGEVLGADTVFIVEGEKCADALIKYGYVATTSPHGAGSWSPEFSKWFEGKTVYLLPDNDAPGVEHMKEVAASLYGKAKALYWVDLSPYVGETGDIADLIEEWEEDNLSEEEIKKNIKGLLNECELYDPGSAYTSGSSSIEDIEREIVSQTLKPQSFPFYKLPTYFQNIVKEFSEAFNVDPEYTAIAVLTIFSACVGNSLWIGAKADWRVPPFLWFTVVQETGGGKSPLLRELMKPLKDLQKGYWEFYQEELKEWKRLSDEEKKGREAPKLKHIYAEDFTTEALAEIFSQDGRGVLIRRDELAGLIGALGQYKKRGGDDRQRLLELFDAEPWKVDRKGKPLFIPRTGASLIGGIQPQTLKRVFDASSFDEGLIPRFLWLVLPTRPRFWVEKEIKEETKAKYNKLIKWACEIEGEGEVRTLSLSMEAKELFKKFNNDAERVYMALPYPLKVFIPKVKTYALKFALLHHLLREVQRTSFTHSDSIKLNTLIQPDSVEFAIELAYFFLGEAKKLIEQFSTPSRNWGLEDAVAEVVIELGKERKGELIPIKEITGRVNEKLSLNLSSRAVGTILKRLGFTEEAGLKKRLRTGQYAILITDTMMKKLVQQVHHLHQAYSPNNFSDELCDEEKKKFIIPSNRCDEEDDEDVDKVHQKFIASSPHGSKSDEDDEEDEEKNQNSEIREALFELFNEEDEL